ncbi:MAG: DUF4129 domain-containing protein, partial [Anaerolineae bacterium]|nr:DUF4129 domain-containing protein [Anaerolineae bacterium]
EQLRSLLRRRLGAGLPPPYLDLSGLEDRCRAVRRLYQALLARATARGWPREAGQTPAVYARALAQRLPRAADALERLTGIYMHGRYGPHPPSPQQVGQALAAWSEIEAALAEGDLSEGATGQTVIS